MQCRDLHWKVEQLEQEKLQLKEKVRALESSSSQNGNQKRPLSPPSASGRRGGEDGDRSSGADDDEHDNDVDDEIVPSFDSDRSPMASPANGSLTVKLFFSVTVT